MKRTVPEICARICELDGFAPIVEGHPDWNGNANNGQLWRRDKLATRFLCARCQRMFEFIRPEGYSGGTGYGIHAGAVHCYICCGELEQSQMRLTRVATLYVNEHEHKPQSVSNWCSSLVFPVTAFRKTDGGFYRRRWSIQFVGPDGLTWSGSGSLDQKQCMNFRACKSKKRVEPVDGRRNLVTGHIVYSPNNGPTYRKGELIG